MGRVLRSYALEPSRGKRRGKKQSHQRRIEGSACGQEAGDETVAEGAPWGDRIVRVVTERVNCMIDRDFVSTRKIKKQNVGKERSTNKA